MPLQTKVTCFGEDQDERAREFLASKFISVIHTCVFWDSMAKTAYLDEEDHKLLLETK